MSRFPFICAALLFLPTGLQIYGEPNEQADKLVSPTFCELVEQPEKFSGKMVSVRGRVARGWTRTGRPIQDLGIGEPWPFTRCASKIIRVDFPEQARPKPDFELIKDDGFHAFVSALRGYTRIEATFQGRFDWSGGADKTTGGSGGGNPKLGMTLVLHNVSELDVKWLPRRHP